MMEMKKEQQLLMKNAVAVRAGSHDGDFLNNANDDIKPAVSPSPLIMDQNAATISSLSLGGSDVEVTASNSTLAPFQFNPGHG